jgi:hypothetical protein
MTKKIKLFFTFTIILLSSISSFPQTKIPQKNRTHEITSTEGIIIKADPKDSSFLIKHTSRIIKFKASNKTVSDYKNRSNMKVQIFYQKLKDGTLFITDIKAAD